MNKTLLDNTDTKRAHPTVTPTVFVSENPEGYEITFELPGVGKDEVDLSIENRTLSLRTKTTFSPPEGFTCGCREFPIYDYAVSLDLPEHADPATVAASVANGVLSVKIAKRTELKPRKIDVTVE